MAPASPRVLIVDDMDVLRRLIIHMLRDLGFTDMVEAHDGSHALGLLRQDRFDLVITDWQMEPMSGYQLLLAMKASRALAEVPLILMSEINSAEHIQLAFRGGCKGYLLKPFSPKNLSRQIRGVFPRPAAPRPLAAAN